MSILPEVSSCGLLDMSDFVVFTRSRCPTPNTLMIKQMLDNRHKRRLRPTGGTILGGFKLIDGCVELGVDGGLSPMMGYTTIVNWSEYVERTGLCIRSC